MEWLKKEPHPPLSSGDGGRMRAPRRGGDPRVGPCTGKKAFLSRSESASGFTLSFPRTISTFTVKGLLQTHTHAHVFLEEGKKFQENLCSVKNEVKIILRMKAEQGRWGADRRPFHRARPRAGGSCQHKRGRNRSCGAAAALPGRVPAVPRLAPRPFPLC